MNLELAHYVATSSDTSVVRWINSDVSPALLTEDEARLVWIRSTAVYSEEADGPGLSVRTAYRDLSCPGSGEECHRRFILPGTLRRVSPGVVTADPIWGSSRLPRSGSSAAERRASVSEEFPAGTLVVDYESSVYRFSKSQAKVRLARLVPKTLGGAQGALIWFAPPKILRSRPVYQFTLEDGAVLEIAKR